MDYRYIDLILHAYVGLILFIALLALHRAARAQSLLKREASQDVKEFVTSSPQLKQVLNDVDRVNEIGENSLEIMANVRKQQRDLKAEVDKASSSISEIEQTLKSIESSTQEFDRILWGPQSKGALGEWMVSQQLSQLPKDWIEFNVPFRNDTRVEFCLRTPDGRLVPIDSKWAGTHLLDQLGKTKDNVERAGLIKSIETEVSRRAWEVHKYIDEDRTMGFAIVAVPDPVFNYTWKRQADLVKGNIVLISYSLLVPYLLLLVKIVFSTAQSTQSWQISGIINRSLAQIADIQRIIDTKVRGTVDSVRLQQSQYLSHNQQLQETYTRLSQIQNDINSVQTSLPNVIPPLFQTDIAIITNTLQKELTILRESLLKVQDTGIHTSEDKSNS